MTNSADFGEFEFTAGSVNGLRAFKVDKLGRLTGVTHESVWKPGENVATCDIGGATIKFDPSAASAGINQVMYAAMVRGLEQGSAKRPSHDTPKATCGCGFWAYYNGDNDFFGPGRVTAVVEGYGRTIVGTKGFRAEKARILGLAYTSVQSSAANRLAIRSAWRKKYAWGLTWRWGAAAFAATVAALAGVNENYLGMSINILLALANAYFAVAFGARHWQDYLGKRCEYAARLPMLHPEKWLADQCGCSRSGSSRDGRSAQPLSPDVAQKLRRNYPDIPVFSSEADLLAAFPVEAPREAEVTPDTAEDFWTRSAS